MTKVSIAAEEQGLEVDLWGHDYTLLPATRSQNRKLRPLQAKLADLEEASILDDAPDDIDDQMVAAVAAILDVLLSPQNGGGKASTHVKRKWKADELTIAQLNAFFVRIEEGQNPPR